MEKFKNWLKANKDAIEGYAIMGAMLLGTYLWGNNRGYDEGYNGGYRNGVHDILDIAEDHSRR